jgi:inner membrane protein
MQDLFANTVNNNFNDVKHQIKEYQNLKCSRYRLRFNIYHKGEHCTTSDTEMFILSQKFIKKDTPGLNTFKTSKTNRKIHEKIEINEKNPRIWLQQEFNCTFKTLWN